MILNRGSITVMINTIDRNSEYNSSDDEEEDDDDDYIDIHTGADV